MPLPRSVKAFLAILAVNTHQIKSETNTVNQISLQNSFGEDFSALLSNSINSNQQLVKDALFSQQELEVSINYGEDSDKILCQGLQWSDDFCPIDRSLTLTKFEEDFTFNDSVGDHICHFMTNKEFNCVLNIEDNKMKVKRRLNNAKTLKEVEIFKCETSDELCFTEKTIEIPSFDFGNCTRSIGNHQKVLPISLTIGGSLFSSVLDNSNGKSLDFFENELTKANLFLNAMLKVRVQLVKLVIEAATAKTSVNVCSSSSLVPTSLENSAFDLVLDSCVTDNDITAVGELCETARVALALTSETEPLVGLLEKLTPLFQGSVCNNDDLVFAKCLEKGLLTVGEASCGNGVIDEGEECECPEGELECNCCSNCILRTKAECDGLNNPCCNDTCQFGTVEDFCELENTSGYCRLGKCQLAQCKSLGYKDFCGLHENNVCKTKCSLLSNEDCHIIDPDNSNLFVRDGTLCPISESTTGVCQTGECVVQEFQEKEEDPFTVSNMALILGFTGFATGLAIFFVVSSRAARRKQESMAHYEGPHINRPRNQTPTPSVTANPAFVTSSANNNVPPRYPAQRKAPPPLPARSTASSRKSWRKKAGPKQVSVAKTPHRSSKRWNEEHQNSVFALDDRPGQQQVNDDVLSQTQSLGSGVSGSTISQSKQKRLSARSKAPPPGLGWHAAAPGPGDVFAYIKEEN